MSLKRHKQDWEDLGTVDPLWAFTHNLIENRASDYSFNGDGKIQTYDFCHHSVRKRFAFDR